MSDILQHCFGTPGGGGPATALSRLLAREDFQYPVVWQMRPAKGISFSLIREMRRQIRQHRPKLVHVRGLGNEGFHAVLAARLAGVPRVMVSIHGTQRDLRNPSNRLRRWIVAHLLETATMLLANRIAPVCQHAASARYVQRFRHKLLEPIPNGVTLPVLSDSLRNDARASLGLAAGLPCVVSVSRLTFEKGLGDLLDAADMLAKQGRKFTLLIVGGGEAEAGLRKRAKSISGVNVVFTGATQNVPQYLAAADIFVFPSWHENLSNSLLEAMSFALPVVATAVGGNVEVISHGGGELVAPHHPKALAQALSAYLDSDGKRAADGAAARRTVEQNYSMDEMVRTLHNRYIQTLSDLK
jgi:glycosyltransferase involved in cell wall biosynthesis